MGSKQRTGLLSVAEDKYFTKKGTLRKVRGKPIRDIGIEFVIYAKVDYVSRKRKISHWKAWLQLTKLKNFLDLMLPHFKKQKGYTYKKAELKIKDEDWIRNFYKNNIVRPRLIKRLKQIDFTYLK